MALDDFMETAADEQIAGADLGLVSELAQAQINAQRIVENLSAQLKTANADVHNLATVKLPEAMAEVGLLSLTLESGAVVSIRDEFGCSMVGDKKPEAMEYLDDVLGNGDLIKCSLIVLFSREDLIKAKTLNDYLETEGFDVKMSQSVHASSLKAWFKRNEEYHDTLPKSLFHTFLGQKAVIK